MEKKQSKLYTEEQVRIMISEARFIDYDDQPLYTDDYLIEQQIAIELPADGEIDVYAKSTGYYGHCTHEFREGIELGAKWMRDKINGVDNG
jgi:hypothetical protein